MSHVVSVVGARPNFVKAAPVVRALTDEGVRHTLVHTGQHYDDAMSGVFFRELALPHADVDLGVGSGTHAQQTAALMVALEPTFADLLPDLVIVYGDVNSTLAAALVAAKTGVSVAHVEAGLRSFDPTMPEEINRKVVDALADLLFVTSPDGLVHLGHEGIAAERVHMVGNPMIDTLIAARPRLDPMPRRAQFGLGDRYAIATLHRPHNVDDADAADTLVRALVGVAGQIQTLLPLHPRGRATLSAAGIDAVHDLSVVEPLGYVDFLSLVAGATLVVTDSGGLQEETTMLGVPCLTVRPNTERPITLTHGTNRLVTVAGLPAAVAALLDGDVPRPIDAPPLWDGRAGARIATIVRHWLAAR